MLKVDLHINLGMYMSHISPQKTRKRYENLRLQAAGKVILLFDAVLECLYYCRKQKNTIDVLKLYHVFSVCVCVCLRTHVCRMCFQMYLGTP